MPVDEVERFVQEHRGLLTRRERIAGPDPS